MIETPTSRWAWKDWVGLVARLVLGGALFIAGLTKVGNLEQSVLAVRGYQLGFIPYELQKMIGYALPVGEIILGLLILAGLFTRITAALGALLMLTFIAAIASVWVRGISIDCGCFGGGGETTDPKYLLEIIRDLAFVACGAWLVVRPRTPFSVDNWLFGPVANRAHELDDEPREDLTR